MEHQEHDTIAKVVVGVLASHRELVPEAELRLPAYGDILIRPGPPLEPATGLLGQLIGQRLVLLEYFSTRPRLVELVRVRAKGFVAWSLELQKKSGLAGAENRRIVIVGNGFPSQALRQAWSPSPWQRESPGFWTVQDSTDTHYVDLLRLPVTPETAWLHVSGDSIWVHRALLLLQTQPDAVTRALLARISEELPHMQVQNDEKSEPRTRRFITAWEEAAARKEGIAIGMAWGRDEGRNEGRNEGLNQGLHEGRNEGLHAMLELILTQRFGEAARPVLEAAASITDPARLQDLARRGLVASSVEALLSEEAQR